MARDPAAESPEDARLLERAADHSRRLASQLEADASAILPDREAALALQHAAHAANRLAEALAFHPPALPQQPRTSR